MTTMRGLSLQRSLSLGGAAVLALLALGVVLVPVVAAASVSTYPVTVTASPKTHTYVVGDSPSITLTEKNNGAATFKATGCTVEIEAPGSTTYSNLSCPKFAAFSLAHGKTAKETYGLYPYKITSSTPTGTYHCKAYFSGTVGGVAYNTKVASFTATIA